MILLLFIHSFAICVQRYKIIFEHANNCDFFCNLAYWQHQLTNNEPALEVSYILFSVQGKQCGDDTSSKGSL